MTDDIVFALMQECLAIPDFQVGTVILKTDFDLTKIDSYSPPFLLLDFVEAGDSGQLIGGVTRMDWIIAMNSYGYAPDTTGDDKTGDSTSLVKIVDVPRRHFSKGNQTIFVKPSGTLVVGNNYMVVAGAITYNGNLIQPGTSFIAVSGQTSYTTTAGGYVGCGPWLTYGMWQILVCYGFRFALSGLHPADHLDGDGLIMGYKIMFDSISFDTDTAATQPSTAVVTSVAQVGNPPF
jgi:hypothetical protein